MVGVQEGDVLAGKCRVERVLGIGGMGVVVAFDGSGDLLVLSDLGTDLDTVRSYNASTGAFLGTIVAAGSISTRSFQMLYVAPQ